MPRTKKRYNVMAYPEDVAYLECLGGGNRSAGLAIAVQKARLDEERLVYEPFTPPQP